MIVMIAPDDAVEIVPPGAAATEAGR
jgi:hypothetical protein